MRTIGNLECGGKRSAAPLLLTKYGSSIYASAPKAVSPLRSATALQKETASVLIIVLWVALGLITIALYFANSMSFELRAADNRVAGIQAEQAVTGAARYVSYVLGNLAQPGIVPDPTGYQCQAVPIGECYFWLLARSTNGQVSLDKPFYGLVDEASKLNLNTATLQMLEMLPRMTPELAASIIDWRDSDDNVTDGGAESDTYGMRQPPYRAKNARFESLEELRLVQNATLDILYGEDANMNGVLDPNENDGEQTPPSDNQDGHLDPGILDYLTVYSHDSTNAPDGTAKINVQIVRNNNQQLNTLLQNQLGSSRASAITRAFNRPGQPVQTNTSLLQFYLTAQSGGQMTSDEFAKLEPYLMIGTQAKEGQINVNTATEAVLYCIPGMSNSVSAVISFRQSASADQLQTIAWIAGVLDAATARQVGPYVTTHSYQFTADICAVGHNGRGFERSKFIFDNSGGTSQIVFRQDLTRLGWPLGQTNRVLLAGQKDLRLFR